MNEQTIGFWAEGALSVRACLTAGSRDVYEVYYTPAKKNAHRAHLSEKDFVLNLCRKKGIPVIEKDAEFFNTHCEGTTHGGLIARVGEKKALDAETLCKKGKPFLAYLCGIEDPYNFAGCLRTLYAAGCDGVFLPKRNWMNAGSVILRSSAGASEFLPMAYVPETADEFIDLLSKYNITPFCAREERAQNLYETKMERPLCLIIGGERRGVDHALDQKIDRGIIIPYGRGYQRSLSAQAACAVISFEILRQQKEQ